MAKDRRGREFVTTNKEILNQCQSFDGDLYKSHIKEQDLDGLFCNLVQEINVTEHFKWRRPRKLQRLNNPSGTPTCNENYEIR